LKVERFLCIPTVSLMPLELSVTLVNMTTDWRQYYTTSSTGWIR